MQFEGVCTNVFKWRQLETCRAIIPRLPRILACLVRFVKIDESGKPFNQELHCIDE